MQTTAAMLAALDMYGHSGRRLRAVLVTGEFVFSCALGTALAVLGIGFADGVSRLVGFWIAGITLNYLPLTITALRLVRNGRLHEVLSGVDLAAARRQASLRYSLLFLPGVLALRELIRLVRRRLSRNPGSFGALPGPSPASIGATQNERP